MMEIRGLTTLLLMEPMSFFSFFPQLFFWLMWAGVAGFFYGFRLLRFKRLIQNMPFSKMGSAAMGLVEVSGRAAGPHTISAGLTNAPCFYYKATAWSRKRSGGRSEWVQVAEERMCVPFYVEDATGKLLVRPQDAEMEAYRTFKQEYDALIFRHRESLPQGVRNFLARHGVDESKDIRLEEHCIRPSDLLFVIGTLGETPEGSSWMAQPHYGGKSKSLGLVVPRRRLGNRTFSVKITRMAGGNTWTESPLAGLDPAGAGTKVIRETLGGPGCKTVTVVMKNNTNPKSDVKGVSLQTLQGPVQLPGEVLHEIAKMTNGAITEEKIGELLRGATENPSEEKGEPLPKISIGMGAPSNLFMISYKSQREVVEKMGLGATLRIWGGPMLAIFCLYMLLALLWTPG